MRALILAAAMAAAAATVTEAPAQEAAERPAPQVAVSGEGRVARAPDVAEISIGVGAEAPEAAAAAEALGERIGPVREALLGAGIPDEAIRTGTLALSPVYAEERGAPGEMPRIAGYRAESLMTVEITRLDEIGRVVGEAIGAGANRLDGIAFGLADREAATDAALDRAVADASRKARRVAEAAGRTLGPIRSITEEGGGGPMPMMRMDAAASTSGIAVAPGEIDVTATVRMTFALEAP